MEVFSDFFCLDGVERSANAAFTALFAIFAGFNSANDSGIKWRLYPVPSLLAAPYNIDMKIIILATLFLSFSVPAFSEKNIRVNFLNKKIEVLPIKPQRGMASLTLENRSFKNFTLKLIKNDKPVRFINLNMSSTKTIDVALETSDKLYLAPYNPSMKMLTLVSSE